MRRFLSVLRVLLALGLLGFIASRIDWSIFRTILQGMNLLSYLGLVLIAFSATLPSAMATRQILRCLDVRREFSQTLKINYLSFFYSAISNFVGGVLRWHLLSGNEKRRGEAFLTIVIERSQGLIIFFGIALCSGMINSYVWIFDLMLGAMLILLFYPKFHNLLENFVNRFSGTLINKKFRLRPKLFAEGFLFLGIYYAVDFGLFVLVTRQVNIELDLVLLSLIYGLAGILILFGLTPLNLGIREGALIFLFMKFGVSKEAALLVSLIFFSFSVFQAVAGGLLFMKEGHKR